MISELTVDTIDQLEDIGHAFTREANYPGGFSLAAFRAAWVPLLKLDLGKLLVYKNGEKIVAALGMAIVPDGFSGRCTALEQFWYVTPEGRKTRAGVELFYRFEKIGIARGAKKLVMVHLANLTPKRLQEFYEKRGYKLVEQTFWKELE
jgi:hypothetical protein